MHKPLLPKILQKAELYLFIVLSALAFYLVILLGPKPSLVGYDYSYFVPRLLEGLLFFRAQGFAIPRYSVYLCGSTPFYADPQSMFYSLPQLLTFFTDVWSAILATGIIFLITGGIGAYLLCWRAFGCSKTASFASAILFAANGFYLHRVIIGHLSYHAYMLTPIVGWLLLDSKLSLLSSVLWGSIAIAYFIHSGAHYVIFISILAVIPIIFLKISLEAKPTLLIKLICLRSLLMTTLAFLLSSSKIAFALSFTSRFPRKASFFLSDSYLEGARMALSQLFLPAQLMFTPYEAGIWEYPAYISPIGGLLALIGLVYVLRDVLITKANRQTSNVLGLLALILSLFVIFQLSSGTGDWLSIKKSLPIFKSMRLNFRFTASFIVILIVLSALALDRLPIKLRIPITALLVTSSFVMWYFDQPLFNSYKSIPYDKIVRTDSLFRSSSLVELIPREIDVPQKLDLDSMLALKSNPRCYATMFKRPVDRFLKPAPIKELRGGYFNMTNPSCFDFPRENECKPRSLIPARDLENLNLILSHRNPSWKISKFAKICIYLNTMGIFIALALGILWLYRLIRSSFSSRLPMGCIL